MVLIKNMYGQTVGKIDIASSNILGTSIRSLFALPEPKSKPRDNDNQIINSSEKTHVIWAERFLLGPYNATLNLAMSEKGPMYRQTIYFFAAPTKLIVGIVVAIVLLLTIYYRIKARLRQND